MGWYEIASAQPFFSVGLTLLAYAAADAMWERSGRIPLLNPVLVASAMLAVLLTALDFPYTTFLQQAQPINDALAAIVVLLAVPLQRQFFLIRVSGGALVAALACGSVVAVVSSLVLPLWFGSDAAILQSIAPKSVTTAVAVELSEQVGGLPGLTAVIVISTGVFGAAFGPTILARAGVVDDRAKGFALGVASHAIGTARAFQISETAGAFASLGMILNAIATLLGYFFVFSIVT